MNKGFSLVEVLIALACSSILILALYQFYQVSSKTHSEMRESWYCMQSIRQACIQLNSDLTQSACLMPQDLKIAIGSYELFIAGAPVTSEHTGISLSNNLTPPYYAIIDSEAVSGVVLDTTDIDNDGQHDFWADLGIITDSGPCVISHNYSRGNLSIPIVCRTKPVHGNRAVPAVHYELKEDGLYRNNQLLAEAITVFGPRISGNELIIFMRSEYHGTRKEVSMSYAFE